jgi:hypothetical protein
MSDDKMLSRIAALLRQAEGTNNAHEAEAFMAAAQRLATATSIDLAVARQHNPARTAAQIPTQRIIAMGEAGTKGLRAYVALFGTIAGANDVKCDVSANNTCVYAYGFPEDIDATHTLYASLVVQMVRACDAYLTTGAHLPTPKVTARLNFHLAFAARIGERLADARDEARQDALQQDATTAPGTALALRNKEIEVTDAYRQASTARGSWRGARAKSGYSASARQAGDRAGREARLAASPELSSARTAVPA